MSFFQHVSALVYHLQGENLIRQLLLRSCYLQVTVSVAEQAQMITNFNLLTPSGYFTYHQV